MAATVAYQRWVVWPRRFGQLQRGHRLLLGAGHVAQVQAGHRPAGADLDQALGVARRQRRLLQGGDGLQDLGGGRARPQLGDAQGVQGVGQVVVVGAPPGQRDRLPAALHPLGGAPPVAAQPGQPRQQAHPRGHLPGRQRRQRRPQQVGLVAAIGAGPDEAPPDPQRRAGQQGGEAQPAGLLGRRSEAGAGAGQVAGAGQRLAQVDQHLAAEGSLLRAQRQRLAQQPDGLVGGTHPAGATGGATVELDGQGGRPAHRGGRVMAGDLGGVLVQRLGVLLAQGLGHPLVQARAHRRRQPVVQAVTEQRVQEGEAQPVP